MSVISLSPGDLAISAVLVAFDAGLSVALKLRLHRQLAVATARMVVQLLIVGFLLRAIFAVQNPAATAAMIAVMAAIAAR